MKTTVNQPAQSAVIQAPTIQLAIPKYSQHAASYSCEKLRPQLFKLPPRTTQPGKR